MEPMLLNPGQPLIDPGATGDAVRAFATSIALAF
jgi:hypothetical protein